VVDEKEAFLSRWSRRKLEAKENTTALPAVAPPAAAPAAAPAPSTEPAAPASPQVGSAAYREFFDPQVDEKLRRTALKELFSDPHFNVMDGLDTYIDDYSIADPIPDAMLRRLNQAKELFLFDDEKQAAEGVAAPAGAAAGAAVASADAAELQEPRPADGPGADAGDAKDAAVAPPAVPLRNC
jgi:hypothetical protein